MKLFKRIRTLEKQINELKNTNKTIRIMLESILLDKYKDKKARTIQEGKTIDFKIKSVFIYEDNNFNHYNVYISNEKYDGWVTPRMYKLENCELI
jgi:hypothetical protein